MSDITSYHVTVLFCVLGSVIGLIKGVFEHSERRRVLSYDDHTNFDGFILISGWGMVGAFAGLWASIAIIGGFKRDIPVLIDVIWYKRGLTIRYLASVLWAMFSLWLGYWAFRSFFRSWFPAYSAGWPRHQVWLDNVCRRYPLLRFWCWVISTLSRPYYFILSSIVFISCSFAVWVVPANHILSTQGIFGTGPEFFATIFVGKVITYVFVVSTFVIWGFILWTWVLHVCSPRFYWRFRYYPRFRRIVGFLGTIIEYIWLGLCGIIGILLVRWFIWPSMIDALMVMHIVGLESELTIRGARMEIDWVLKLLLYYWNLYQSSPSAFWTAIREIVINLLWKIKQYFASRPPRRPGW